MNAAEYAYVDCRVTALRASRRRAAWFALLLVAVTGCTTQIATTRPPPPELNLVSSADFRLPKECKPEPGDIYRAQFTVRSDGAVSEVQTVGDADCAREALTRWVSSFRYEAPASPVTTVVDWMLVEARRGG